MSFKALIEKHSKIKYINLKHNLIQNADIFKDKIFINREIILEENNIPKKDLDEIKKILMNKEFENIGNIIYNLDKSKNKIRIFGKDFVAKNKKNCKIVINNKQKELTEFYKYNKINKNETLEIKIILNQNVTSFYSLFNDCSSLISLSGISEWEISQITDMSLMFSGCQSLSSIPDISKWNTMNVSDMSMMFSGCKSLKELPDISMWNISNVNNMNYMFSKCEKLENLPDLSKWNTSNIKNMSCMFSRCESLISLPDLSKWNTSNVNNMSCMFNECSSLSKLPDISGWDISKVTDKSNMFSGCKKIKRFIPKKFLI